MCGLPEMMLREGSGVAAWKVPVSCGAIPTALVQTFVPASCSPVAGIEPGHIPGTINIPFTDFLTEDGLEKSPEDPPASSRTRRWTCPCPWWPRAVPVSQPATGPGGYLCGKPDTHLRRLLGEWYARPNLRTSPRAGGRPTEAWWDTEPGDTQPPAIPSLVVPTWL